MELIHAHQLSFPELRAEQFDVLIAASGYETRCIELTSKMSIKKNAQKYVLAFKEKTKDSKRKANDKFFSKAGFHSITVSGEDKKELHVLLDKIFNRSREKEIKIFVDYSSMTKMWYAAILEYLMEKELPIDKIDIYFGYTPAKYVPPRNVKHLKNASPIMGEETISTSYKPIALVLGLGYEPQRAEFMVKKVQPNKIIILYPDPGFEMEYVGLIKKNNQKLVESLPPENIYCYSIRSLESIDSMLTSIALQLRLKYRIIIAPLGPKPFSLLSILLGIRYPDIQIWRASAGKKEFKYEREPFGDPLIYRCSFHVEGFTYH